MRPLMLVFLAMSLTMPAAAGPGEQTRAEAKAAKKAAKKARKEAGKSVIDDGEARFNGEPVARVVDDPVNRYSFTIADLDGTERLYLRWVSEGPYNYFEGYRADDLKTLAFDTESYVGYRKWLIKSLAEAGVLTTEGWSEEAYQRFEAKTGTRQTDLRKQEVILIRDPGN